MQVEVMQKFWQEVIDKKPDMEEAGMKGWVVGATFLGVMEHSEMGGQAKDPGRVMFNLETSDVKGEFERISKIEGVKVVKEPYSMGEHNEFWIATLADPDGNYFQLVSPWNN